MKATVRAVLRAVVVLALVAAAGPAAAQTRELFERQVRVNCDRGDTIGNALNAIGTVLVIDVVGTCLENVDIVRDKVTLRAGAPGARVQGAATDDTISVGGARIRIEGLEIRGGRTGVSGQGARNLVLRNVIVSGNQTGVRAAAGSNVSIEGTSTITGNSVDGVTANVGGVLTVSGATISSNGRFGVLVADGAVAILGPLGLSGNTITQNGGIGVNVIRGKALVRGNTIASNGGGITVYQGAADLLGNTVENNGGFGVAVFGGQARLGDGSGPGANFVRGNQGGGVQASQSAAVDVRSATITGNQGDGVQAALNAAVDVRNTTIANNAGRGVNASFNATAMLTGGSISGNGAGGVRLHAAGVAFFGAGGPAPSVLTASGFGLECDDFKSQYGGNVSGITVNRQRCATALELLPPETPTGELAHHFRWDIPFVTVDGFAQHLQF